MKLFFVSSLALSIFLLTVDTRFYSPAVRRAVMFCLAESADHGGYIASLSQDIGTMTSRDCSGTKPYHAITTAIYSLVSTGKCFVKLQAAFFLLETD